MIMIPHYVGVAQHRQNIHLVGGAFNDLLRDLSDRNPLSYVLPLLSTSFGHTVDEVNLPERARPESLHKLISGPGLHRLARIHSPSPCSSSPPPGSSSIKY
eukprot:Hpha_TRINITY_DN10898_c0_g1::TRINITY_DN10898_c0_g1_i1::g.23425::m.23425